MKRREALAKIGVLVGGYLTFSSLAQSCISSDKKRLTNFSSKDIALLDSIAETIIPETDTLGANSAEVGTFVALMVKDCYPQEEQTIFVEGLTTINDKAKKKYNENFVKLLSSQKKDLLLDIDRELKEYQLSKKDSSPVHYFFIMKELVLLGFFTSEIGSTRVLRYIETPGRYDSCLPYKKGDRAWQHWT